MRNRFDEQLEQLNVELIKMGALCEESISCAVKALFDEKSAAMIDKVNANEQDIDHLERDIEALCMKLLLQQQPVAKDLRTVSSALKMISDMERIGDQSQDIAEIAGFVHSTNLAGKVHISEMATKAVKMVTMGIDSFVKKDLALAQRTIDMDDNVDRLFLEVKNELVELIREDTKDAEYFMDLLMAAKYLERIGDHATNIAEWVIFSITGEH
ncbi:MAG: phosphate signaling complex protein PhoU [Oscillospiraceae bacterium]|nr:phosphate signaling complex protein PhoU [Oscillospiraceae bacterium]